MKQKILRQHSNQHRKIVVTIPYQKIKKKKTNKTLKTKLKQFKIKKIKQKRGKTLQLEKKKQQKKRRIKIGRNYKSLMISYYPSQRKTSIYMNK